MNTTIGLFIPNSDFQFNAKIVKSISKYVFIISQQNEILVFEKQEDILNVSYVLEKKFILFTHPQIRRDIIDIFIVNTNTSVLDSSSIFIVTITDNFIINFWNIKDGLCFNNVNLSCYKKPGDNLLEIQLVEKRFLLFIFTNRSFIFDSSTHVILKEEKFNFEIFQIYRLKETKFYFQSKNNETYIAEIQTLPVSSNTNELCINYEEIRYRIVKHSFNITKIFNIDTQYTLVSNSEFIFYNLNQKIFISFLDSVEELTELSNLNTNYKFKIIHLDKLTIKDTEYLLVIYKDLTCEIFFYDKKLREIKKEKKFIIMIEDEFLSMKFCVSGSLLIGFVDDYINIFDLAKFIDPTEKYVDKTIELFNIFGNKRKNLFVTNYFRENFSKYYKSCENILLKKNYKFAKDYFNKDDEGNNDIFNSDNKTHNFKITASTIYANPDNQSIYYILGTNTGKVAIIDIFFNEDYTLNPMIIIDYHTAPIESFNIFEHKYLITSSSDGLITFTEISKEKLVSAFFSANNNNNNVINEEDSENVKKNIIDSPSSSSAGLNYSYSKKKSLTNKNMESMIILEDEVKDGDNNYGKIINLLPILTFKNYYKLTQILTVTQLDNYQVTFDQNHKRKGKALLAFELEDNSVKVINMDTLKTVYSFNQTSEKICVKAIYHITYEKCLIFYLDNNTIKISNYATKTIDRIVTDINKIYNILRVEEKLKLFFVDYDNILLKNFTEFCEFKENKKKEVRENGSSTNLINSFSNNGSSTNLSNLSNNKILGYNNIENNQISLEYIKEYLTNDKERFVFINKYLHNVYNKRKIQLNITLNKFESVWMKKIEIYIIHQIFEIINSPFLIDNLKKILILNLLFNPMPHYKIFDRYEYTSHGFEGNILKVGNQLNEYLSLNFEDFFIFIEKVVNEQKNSKTYLKQKVNYYNFISIFHIWNLSIDQDINIINFLKIYQPIFDFNFILHGCDSSLTLLLNEEVETDGDFADHFNFFTKYFEANEQTKKNYKDEKYSNKKYIVNRQQGYLVNMKNYKFSSNLSHFLNLTFFGSLIAILGFEESNELCRLMSSEMLLIRSLSQQKYIKFSNLNIIDKFIYDCIDDINLANKDIILVQYLMIKNNCYIDSSKSLLNGHENQKFLKKKIIPIINYLENIYALIFGIEKDDEPVNSFYKFNKEKNVDGSKLKLLTEFELSLINLIITINCLNEKSKIDEIHMTKVVELLILFIFKILQPNNSGYKTNFSRIIVELLSKVSDTLEIIYKENTTNYAKFLIDMYTNVKIPIDLDGLFKKYDISNCSIIKSEDNYNFLKIMLAKLLKNFSKIKISFILKLIVEEFKKKITEYDYFSYLLEILWILFREKSAKQVQYLPTLINLIMTTMSPTNKEMRNTCLDNSKKVLSCLLPNYPMISFHQNSQVDLIF